MLNPCPDPFTNPAIQNLYGGMDIRQEINIQCGGFPPSSQPLFTHHLDL